MINRMFGALLTVALVVGAVLAGTAQARQAAGAFTVTPLVSDGSAAPAAATDPSLVNGWGLSAGPTTPWWASDNGTNVSTLYSGTGAKTPLTVSVPGGPTGTVFNGSTTDFVVTQNGVSGAARFLFATEGGTILGWTPTVNGTVAVFDASFKLLTTTGGFKEANVATGLAPFGIQTLDGDVFVTHAKQDAAKPTTCPCRARRTWTSSPRTDSSSPGS